MPKNKAFLEHLKQQNKNQDLLNLADALLIDLQEKVAEYDVGHVRAYVDSFIAGSEDAYQKIVILFWYFEYVNNKACSTYLITLFGILGVIESQRDRIAELLGSETAEKVFAGIQCPPFGSDVASYPQSIIEYVSRIQENISPADSKKALAGNHHNVDVQNFQKDKELYLQSTSLESFPQAKHGRLVENLRQHSESGKLWFEQHITPEVVEYVKAHQEIQTGIIQGDSIIVQKIPYNPEKWLQESDPKLKRYHACHCPFVREALVNEQAVPSLWCYCSGGYTKLFFDYIFEDDLEVELLESVLQGDQSCKFAIKLPRGV